MYLNSLPVDLNLLQYQQRHKSKTLLYPKIFKENTKNQQLSPFALFTSTVYARHQRSKCLAQGKGKRSEQSVLKQTTTKTKYLVVVCAAGQDS